MVAALALLAGLVTMAGTAFSATPNGKCADNKSPTTVTVGIVQMLGCWTESSVNGVDYYTADLSQQPTYGSSDLISALDMNGFLVTGSNSQSQIVVNRKTDAIRSVKADGTTADNVQLWSIGYPKATEPTKLGELFKINFTPPPSGQVTLEDLRLGGNDFVTNLLAGFNPVGDVETPIILAEDGKGSMDLTIRLTGVFTLKGHPQSASIKIPSKVGEGSRVDGFSLKLEEIDGIKLLDIRGLEAEYSASEKKLAGTADLAFPFMSGRGISFSIEIENAIPTKAAVGVSGIRVPIGAPPGGFLTALNGGVGFKQTASEFVLNLNAAATAEFGPELPTPWGKVVPIEVSSALKLGKEKQDWYFLFDGGVKVFRLNVGNVYLKIHTDSGVQFGFSIGIGFPSYSNNPDDPFYIGAGVDGWVAKRHFQFTGNGRVRLAGLNIFDGWILINTRAAGACWKVLGIDGGAVYEYGQSVQTFGVTCGLDRYREAYPTATRRGDIVASASQPRRLKTGNRTAILTVRGKDGAPRFSLRSKDGRSFSVPRGKDAVRTKSYMIVADEKHNRTSVFTPRLRNGQWTITPYEGSTPVMGVKVGQSLPPERVRARVSGRGLTRTLAWNSTGNPNTRISFTEVMRGGYEQPILTTNKARGSFRFKATKGSHYGKRRLRAYVIHGGAPREVTVEDLYTVRKPGRLAAPRKVQAWRNVYTAAATWRGVKGARGYVAEIAVKKNGRKISSYRRVTGPRVRRFVVPRHPGGTWALASVQALNADGVPGKVAVRKFRLAPPKSLNLRQASRQGSASARRIGGKVKLRTLCPINGHCQTRVLLRLNGKTIGQASFQQVPGTYRHVELSPASQRLRRLLAQGRLNRMRVTVQQHRSGTRGVRFGSGIGGL